MALEDTMRSLREFDLGNLDFDNVGSWPVLIKALIWLALLSAVLVGGYYYHIEDLQVQLAQAEETEVTLKKDFEKKAFEAANLEAYRQQMAEMEESFGALVSQLPSDTEVPGLLEDITNKGLLNGLEIASIDLQPEQAKEFYVELPIAIVASGSYHDLGAFISGMAGLPRIVTLHDFQISADPKNPNSLNMVILAKTYRYKDEEAAAL
jgi:type IV pilus assembly protein PilO